MADKISRVFRIDFAKLGTDWRKYEKELVEAVKHANRNLFYRYDIMLRSMPLPTGFYVEMLIPEWYDIGNPGNRLRGVSAYLMKEYRDTFSKLTVGSRLLLYTEMFIEKELLSAWVAAQSKDGGKNG